MKKLSYIVLLITFFSCDPFFQDEEISIAKIESYQELESAVWGVYASLAEAFHTSGAVGFMHANIKADDLSNDIPKYWDWSGNESFCNYSQEISTQYYDQSSYTYRYLFATIISANNIIRQLSPIEEEPLKNQEILGEVFFLRAYCYFRLSKVYGPLPLIDDIEISYTKPLASFEELYSFIEDDLLLAITFLPSNNSNSRLSDITPHRGTAKALLAELYLFWGGYPVFDESKFELAADMAEQVIDSSEYFGFNLMADFAQLWDREHCYNQESVFTLYFTSPYLTTEPGEVNWLYAGQIFDNQLLDSTNYAYLLNQLTLRFPAVEHQFYSNYPAGYRKDITFFNQHYLSDEGIIHYRESHSCVDIGYRKFYYEPEVVEYSKFYAFESLPLFFGDSKVYLYRYAHTLLTFAEASARAGSLNEKSYQSINQIRRRAHRLDPASPSVVDLQAGLSPQVFVDSVLWERAWEFAGEPEGRWFDLVRSGWADRLEELRLDAEGGVPAYPVTTDDYYLPIPAEEQLLNPYLMY